MIRYGLHYGHFPSVLHFVRDLTGYLLLYNFQVKKRTGIQAKSRWRTP